MLVNVLVKGKVWKVPLEWAKELAKKGWKQTTRAAPNAPKMTKGQLNKVPSKTTAFDEAKHAEQVAADLRKGAGRQGSQRGAGTSAVAEGRAARETARANKAAERIREAKQRKVDRMGRGDGQLPAVQTGRTVQRVPGQAVVVSPGRTPTVWKGMPETKAKSIAKKAAGKDPKGWWAKRSRAQKNAILLATGFGAGAIATQDFEKWFGIGGAAVKALPPAQQPTKVGPIDGPDKPPKKRVVSRGTISSEGITRYPSGSFNAAFAKERKKAMAAGEPDTGEFYWKGNKYTTTIKSKEPPKVEERRQELKDSRPRAGKRIKTTQKSKKKVKEDEKPGWMPWNWIRIKGDPHEAGPGLRVYKTPLGEIEVDTSDEDDEFVGMNKKGGQIKKSVKKAKAKPHKAKTKTRRRAALRGGRAELRGG